MEKLDDLLQERLERLETGETLDDCLEGIPDEVAMVLLIADRLKAIEWPVQSTEQTALQRTEISKTEPFLPTPEALPNDMAASRLAAKKQAGQNAIDKIRYLFLRNDLRIPVLFAGAATVIACFMIVFVGAGLIFSPAGRYVIGQLTPQNNEYALVETSAVEIPPVEKSEVEETPTQDVAKIESPSQAMIQALHGVVQVMDAENGWQSANAGFLVEAGAHLRTGALSSATLVFYDGSRTLIGSQSEVVVEEVYAGRGDASRVIVLNQLTGESEHDVVHSSHSESRYEVHTAAATVEALGTKFKVSVNAHQGVLFQVTEGKVSVTGSDTSVMVGSGQATSVNLDEPPADPTYFFYGQGPVALVGDNWVVSGQLLKTHLGTVIIGNPQVGDEVFFEGRLQADDTRLVDLIVLVQRSPANRFSLTGPVETISEFWIINGQQIAVTDITLVDPEIAEGDLVEVEGLIMNDGTLQAETIRRLEEAPGLPFDFTGVLQTMPPDAWVISDIEIVVTETTVISESLVTGDIVRATGWILADGKWQAERVQRVLDTNSAFEFTGLIESTDPWEVAEVSFETRDWTLIDDGLLVGDQVRVKGQIMPDGTWVAAEIRRLDDLTEIRVVLVGLVIDTDPWIVSGITLNVDDETLIAPEVVLGMLVKVEIQVLEDGTWKVIRIDPLDEFELQDGCQEVTAVVVSVSDHQIQLNGWPLLPLGEGAEVNGELKPNSVVIVQICYDDEGNLQIVYIYIILEPEIIETPEAELPGEKVLVCHKPNSKNPHTIVISRSALPAHLGHGDTEGPCP